MLVPAYGGQVNQIDIWALRASIAQRATGPLSRDRLPVHAEARGAGASSSREASEGPGEALSRGSFREDEARRALVATAAQLGV